uniref:Uncharacterized protein n=1 Tax=Meloidogyne hapla TaxID=6305 RepID=A0A1I8C131_MELHA
MEKVMIERQREVTGNYNYGDEDNAKVEDWDYYQEEDGKSRTQKIISKINEDTTERNELKNGKKKLRKRGGKGSRFN